MKQAVIYISTQKQFKLTQKYWVSKNIVFKLSVHTTNCTQWKIYRHVIIIVDEAFDLHVESNELHQRGPAKKKKKK